MYHLVGLIGRSVCYEKQLKISIMYIFPVAFDSYMDGFSSFSGNLFAVLVYSLEVGDIGSGIVVGNAVYVNCTGDMTTVFSELFQRKSTSSNVTTE